MHSTVRARGSSSGRESEGAGEWAEAKGDWERAWDRDGDDGERRVEGVDTQGAKVWSERNGPGRGQRRVVSHGSELDIGFELAFAATAVFYPPLRYLELRFRSLV